MASPLKHTLPIDELPIEDWLSLTKRIKIDPNILCKTLDQLLNPKYRVDTPFFQMLKSHYHYNEVYKHQTTEFGVDPFKYFILEKLFSNRFLNLVKNEINEHVKFSLKSNDLFRFYQSGDLKGIHTPLLKLVKLCLYSKEFVNFLGNLLGIELFHDKLDVSISRYDKGDYLLCHDDHITTETTGRRVAFILYLVDEDWDASCGGELSLFNVKPPSQLPDQKVAQLVPKWNHLAFFEIGNHSYHQVEEVLSATKSRLSIVGWFHGPLPTSSPPMITYSPLDFRVKGESITLEKFVNPTYLKPESLEKIQARFIDESCIELGDFLNKSIFDEIITQLPSVSDRWSAFVGPPHLRRYRVLKPLIVEDAPATKLDVLIDFFQSVTFRDYLKQLTSLAQSSLLLETREFSADCYTMIVDNATEPFGLDIVLTLAPGGAIHYVADEETLLTLDGRANCLQLVLRDEGTHRFLKKLPRDFEGARVDLSLVGIEATSN